MSTDKRTLRAFLFFLLVFLLVLVVPGSATTSAGGTPAVPAGPAPARFVGKPSTVTDADGVFRFAHLERGTHQLFLDPSTLPGALRPAAGAPEVSLWINPGQSLVSDLIGPGVRFNAHYDVDGHTISGTVFVDEDGDGTQGPTEMGLPGVTVVDPTVHQYYVPFNDNDLWTLFAEINDDDPTVGQCLNDSTTSTDLESFISLTASSNGTVYYYDHWEDGYDPDPLTPGPTTESSVIDAGVTKTFNNIVTTPVTTTVLLYDGRDRITIFGEPASVIRAAYPQTPGEVLAGAWEIPEIADWGQSFVTVIGEDLDFNGGATDDFDYVGLQIMAAQAGTEVWVNGTLVDTLDTGGTHLIDGENNGLGGGGVQSNDVITATGPIQVQMMGAACDINWSARAFTLQPVGKWDQNYWAPVPDFEEGAWCDITSYGGLPDDRDTDIYIHNPHDNAITVNFEDGGGPVALNVPARTTVSALAILNAPPYNRDLSATIGAHLYSDAPFWGVSAVDSNSGDSANSFSSVNDWGYSLVPVNRLSSQVVLGWSPGNSNVPPTSDPAHNNGSLAFVSVLTDTVIYVDFTQDGLPDAFDINGDGDADDFDVFANPNFDERISDDGIPLSAGEVLRVADPNDNDLTGAVIYSPELGAKVAVAWGQDPCRSTDGAPYLDLGYTVLPFPIPSISKQSELAVDADTSNDITPGDTLSYTIVLLNNGKGPLLNGILTDTLPYTHTDYVVGSLSVTQPPPLDSTDFANGGGWGYTPAPDADGLDPAVQAFRLTWPRIEAGQIVTITYAIRLDEDLPSGVDQVSNQAVFRSDDTDDTESQDPSDPFDPDTDVPVGQPILQIDKVDEPDPVRPGQLLTYTIVATNTGTAAAVGDLFLESLPNYVTYVSDTLDLTLPRIITDVVTSTVPYTTTFTGSYADDFDAGVSGTTVYTGNDGTLDWSDDWSEVLDDDDPNAGDVQIGTAGDDLSPDGYLELGDNDAVDSGLVRTLDLSEFVSPTLSYYVAGIGTTGADDTYSVLVNGNPLAGFPEAYDGTYQRRRLDLSAYAGSAGVTLQFAAAGTIEAGEVYRIDNVVVYEASPLRSATRTVVDETETLTYTTQTNINPVSYDSVANTMTVVSDVQIPAAAFVRFSFQVRVAIPLPDGMQLLNTAAITSTNVMTNPYPLEDTEPTTVLSSHALTITKTAITDTVFLGQRLTYNLAWEVGGDEPAPGLVVTDTLPVPYVSFVSCDGGLSCNFIAPDTIVWDLGDRLPIASGITYDSGVLTATVRAEQFPPGGVFTNTAIIDDDTDTPTDEDDEPTNVIDAGFVLDKRRVTPSPVEVDEPVQFLIVITNTGALTITRLPLEDTYDTTYLSYQGATPASDDDLDDGVINWSDLTVFAGPLAPGGEVQVLVDFVAITSTQHLTPPVTVNVAASEGAQTDQGDLPRVEDEDDVEVRTDEPTAIELLYLRAGPKGGGVLIEWATLFEIDTHGFWLYRAAQPDLDRARSLAFVPAEGWLGLGATYAYLDTGLPPGHYYYWLVEVENSGKETTYGPVGASPGWSEADLPHRIYLPVIWQH